MAPSNNIQGLTAGTGTGPRTGQRQRKRKVDKTALDEAITAFVRILIINRIAPPFDWNVELTPEELGFDSDDEVDVNKGDDNEDEDYEDVTAAELGLECGPVEGSGL